MCFLDYLLFCIKCKYGNNLCFNNTLKSNGLSALAADKLLMYDKVLFKQLFISKKQTHLHNFVKILSWVDACMRGTNSYSQIV